MQNKIHNSIYGYNLAKHNEQSEAPLFTDNGSVYLKGLMCIDLHRSLSRKSYLDLLQESRHTEESIGWNDHGSFGSQFFVSTSEI
jgi:hypothetical protein